MSAVHISFVFIPKVTHVSEKKVMHNLKNRNQFLIVKTNRLRCHLLANCIRLLYDSIYFADWYKIVLSVDFIYRQSVITCDNMVWFRFLLFQCLYQHLIYYRHTILKYKDTILYFILHKNLETLFLIMKK